MYKIYINILFLKSWMVFLNKNKLKAKIIFLFIKTSFLNKSNLKDF